MKALFPYIGGKHKVAGNLIGFFPEHKCYVEVFGGAASVLFAKKPCKVEVLNDINGEIVNIFHVIRYHPDEFLKELTLITHSRQEFVNYHAQPGLTDIQRAARRWFNLKVAFGGKGLNYGFARSGSARLNNYAYETILQSHARLDGVFVENDDFEKIIRRYDGPYTFFFCDPLYWQTVDYGIKFLWSDHERLAKTLRNIKGKFLLTINCHPDIKRLYKDLPRMKFVTTYTVPIIHQKVFELIIANYPLPKQWCKRTPRHEN